MSKKLMNTDSKLAKVKHLCAEQLWLVLLFAPLLLVAIFVGEHYLSKAKQSSGVNGQKSSLVAGVAAQITSIELAAIIAKPLGELLLMEVYFSVESKARNQYGKLDLNSNGVFNDKVLMSQYSSEKMKLVSVQLPIKSKKNKVGEHS